MSRYFVLRKAGELDQLLLSAPADSADDEERVDKLLAVHGHLGWEVWLLDGTSMFTMGPLTKEFYDALR
jgi:hypothetical protein